METATDPARKRVTTKEQLDELIHSRKVDVIYIDAKKREIRMECVRDPSDDLEFGDFDGGENLYLTESPDGSEEDRLIAAPVGMSVLNVDHGFVLIDWVGIDEPRKQIIGGSAVVTRLCHYEDSRVFEFLDTPLKLDDFVVSDRPVVDKFAIQWI